MTIENVPLFDLATPETLTPAQLMEAFENGIDPRTGQVDEDFHEDMREAILDMWREVQTPIGTFKSVTNWNLGDGHDMGLVAQHVETGMYILLEGTYSSWDGSEYDRVSVAEPYTFTETRYRAVS
jgi:hypothetical protein